VPFYIVDLHFSNFFFFWRRKAQNNFSYPDEIGHKREKSDMGQRKSIAAKLFRTASDAVSRAIIPAISRRMFGSFCDLPKFLTVYSKTSLALIREVLRNPGWGNTALDSDRTLVMNKCAYVSDFATGPGGVQAHSGEKVSEKVSGNTFANEGLKHGAIVYVTQYCYGCLYLSTVSCVCLLA
jgi:hypothetical protein